MATARRSPVLPIVAFGAVALATTYFILLAVHVPFTWQYGVMGLFLVGITAVLHVWQEGALTTDPKGFVNRFMLGLVLKMLLSLLVIVIILFTLPRVQAVPMALTFAVLYLAFLIFSTVRMSMLSRNSSR